MTFGVLIVSYFTKYLQSDNINVEDQILRYLTGNQDRSITFRKKLELCLFWYLNFKQVVITLFSTKADYITPSLVS